MNSSRLFHLAERGINSVRTRGVYSTIRSIRGLIKRKLTPEVGAIINGPPNVEVFLRNSMLHAAPKTVLPVPDDVRRLTLVTTERLVTGSLFGGAGTSLIIAALIAKQANATLRIVTTGDRPNPSSIATVLEAAEIDADIVIEFLNVPHGSTIAIPYHRSDRFITTSWWTTSAMSNIDPGKIYYILQEDERLFYPAGDDLLQCSATLKRRDGLTYIINTQLLQNHLISDGVVTAENSIAFEPSFPKKLFYNDPNTKASKSLHTLLFYARPNHPRNLFKLGLAVLDQAIARGIINSDWQIVLCGTDIPQIKFDTNIPVVRRQNLGWQEYAALVRSVDVGLSLMLSPHPSYPPLDMAACGAFVVTTQNGVKSSLDMYSDRIFAAEPTVEALVEALRDAILRSTNESKLSERELISRDWKVSTSDAVSKVVNSWSM